VLLVFVLIMNRAAILLRRRFEHCWQGNWMIDDAPDPKMTKAAKITARKVQADTGDGVAVTRVDVDISDRAVTAFTRLYGRDNTAVLRCLNRMNDTIPTSRVQGDIRIDCGDI
jgi:ABC-type proline/glycine betaine transport system ATPase subunit